LDDEILARAMRAMAKAASRAGAETGDPVILYRSRRICVLLPESAIVARIVPANDENFIAENRELAVSRYLFARGAPVVGPSKIMPSEPYVEEGMLVSLWPHIVHGEADYEDIDEVARAAHALQRIHDAFDDYPGALPSYSDRIEECATLLCDPAALPILNAEDRAFLIRTHERLSNVLATFDILPRPIHGDAHMGNVFITPSGPLWMDFEAASRGPREWDAAGAPYLPAFHSLNPELYAIMSELRSVCVAVWCSALAADPDKRAAAQYQLAHLRAGREC
jgi:Phosphotransferase enzyme family